MGSLEEFFDTVGDSGHFGYFGWFVVEKLKMVEKANSLG